MEGCKGNHIYIDQDPWLNRLGNRSPILTPEDLKWSRVNNLIKENDHWNDELIRGRFLSIDVDDILNIPLGSDWSKDEIIWALDNKGIFSVKSAYHCTSNIAAMKEGSSSDGSISKKLWKNMWSLKIIPRAKISVWKILNDYIPSKFSLIKKGIDINPRCEMCKCRLETSSHAL